MSIYTHTVPRVSVTFQMLTWSVNGFYLHSRHGKMKGRPFPTIHYSFIQTKWDSDFQIEKQVNSWYSFYYCGCRITIVTAMVCQRFLWLWAWLTITKTSVMDTFSAVRFLLFVQKYSFHPPFLCCMHVGSPRAELKAGGPKQLFNRKKPWAEPWTQNLTAGILWNFFYGSAGHLKLKSTMGQLGDCTGPK